MQVMVGSRARWARRTVAAVAALGLGTALSGCATPRWQSELASVNGAGTGSGNDLSWRPNVSRDGTKVVFESEASDLGPADANGVSDIYMRDLTTGTTQLISRSASGSGAGDGPSTGPEFWRPGRAGRAGDWVANDQPGHNCLRGKNPAALDFPEPGPHLYSWGIVRSDASQVRMVTTSGDWTTATIGSEVAPGIRAWIGRRYTDQISRFEALDSAGNVLHSATAANDFDTPQDSC